MRSLFKNNKKRNKISTRKNIKVQVIINLKCLKINQHSKRNRLNKIQYKSIINSSTDQNNEFIMIIIFLCINLSQKNLILSYKINIRKTYIKSYFIDIIFNVVTLLGPIIPYIIFTYSRTSHSFFKSWTFTNST